jgi:hypothetical protein
LASHRIVSYRMVLLADGLDGGWMAGVRVGKRSHFFPIYLSTYYIAC